MNATVLALLLWGLAAAGVVAVVLAVTVPRLRVRLLVAAAVLFLPIGILGILSIGWLFLAAAAGCLAAAVATARRGTTSTPAG